MFVACFTYVLVGFYMYFQYDIFPHLKLISFVHVLENQAGTELTVSHTIYELPNTIPKFNWVQTTVVSNLWYFGH